MAYFGYTDDPVEKFITRGVVKWFDPIKGFGFIEVKNGDYSGEDVFVHASDITGNPLRDEDLVYPS